MAKKPRSNWNKEKTERNSLILQLRREGVYLEEIARRVGLSRERVKQILYRARARGEL